MSSSLGAAGRQSYKRRGIRQSKRPIHITIDLNSPAPGADDMNVASSSRSFQHVQSNPLPIYVDDADDDVQMLPASTFSRLTAPPPVSVPAPIVVLDDEEEINPGPSGVAREERDRMVNLDLSLDFEWIDPVSQRKETPNPTLNLIPVDPVEAPLIQMEPPPPPPKEITFSCPVCMSALVEPSSTICGHIFCKECIKASIQAQKKCPTCRKHLNMKNFHRVYLPSTE